MALFSWGKKQTIKDLTPAQLIQAATQLLRKSGRNQTSFRLIFHCLVSDPYEPTGIIRLAECFDDGHIQHKPTHEQMLAALVLDYALGYDSHVPEDHRANLQKMRLKLLWAWGFAKPIGKKTSSNIEEEASAFEIDDQGFLNTVSKAGALYGSFNNAFATAHTLIGLRSGLVRAKNPDAKLEPWQITRSNHIPAPDYEEWLKSEASQLTRLGVNLDISA